MACAIATFALLVEQPNGSNGPSIEIGVVIAAVSPAIALVGLGMVQAARARERAVQLGL